MTHLAHSQTPSSWTRTEARTWSWLHYVHAIDRGTTALTVISEEVGAVGGRRQVSSEGYAIPINTALDIAGKIESGQGGGNIQIGPPAFLGVVISSGSSNGFSGGSTGAAVVQAVQPGTPAARAGLAAGDEIVGLDGRTVDSPTALKSILKTHKPGDRVSIRWLDSSGGQHTATVQLASGPPA